MRALYRRLPAPLKRRLVWLAAWVYWARRRLRQRRAGGAPAPAAEVHGAGIVAGAQLPAGAPDAVVARNEYGIYCVPRSSVHRPVAAVILDGGVWERRTLELMQTVDSAGDIVHAGTYYGDFLPALARSRAEGALVWAFEPGAENHRCTEITISLNELHNVVLTRAGLGERSGSGLLAVGGRDGVSLGGSASMIQDPLRARLWDSEAVPMAALDEVVPADRRVALIQLDVEGHEKEALLGALGTIERCRPLIILESLPRASWLEEHLGPFGYRARESIEHNTVLSCA
jgi:FkbM family methyltransferase